MPTSQVLTNKTRRLVVSAWLSQIDPDMPELLTCLSWLFHSKPILGTACTFLISLNLFITFLVCTTLHFLSLNTPQVTTLKISHCHCNPVFFRFTVFFLHNFWFCSFSFLLELAVLTGPLCQ